MVKNKPAAGVAGGIFLVASLFLTACDSDNDAHDLQSRVEVAANNYTSLQMSAINDIIEIGQSQQLTLNALTDNGPAGTSVRDSAFWSVDNPNIATVDQTGVVTGVADGVANVRARYGPLFATPTAVQVSSADLVAIQISASVESVNECDSVQLTANGIYSDGLAMRNLTDDVLWQADGTTTVGTFEASDPSGFFRTTTAGQLSVTASRGGIVVDPSFSLPVLDNLSMITIPEPAGTLTTSNNLQLSASATYDNGTMADISKNASWSVSDASVATIGNSLASKGLLNASQTGSVTVSAVCGGALPGVVTLLSGDPAVVEEVVFGRDSPHNFNYTEITTLQLNAYVRLQTQERVLITDDSRWTFVERGNTLNTLSNSSESKGELIIRGTGKIVVRVEYTGDVYDDEGLNQPDLEINPF